MDVDKILKTSLFVDPSCPFYTRRERKSKTFTNYDYEIVRMWKLKKVDVIPVIVEALGTMKDKMDRED